ncbi:hypothetical protein, partial [Sphingomonas sp. 37zxx]|uniref:hypothetical protein n=1 Tax=Sphingomonas sp. 37zxx TaxID=1550073 RepID=UPI001E491F0E
HDESSHSAIAKPFFSSLLEGPAHLCTAAIWAAAKAGGVWRGVMIHWRSTIMERGHGSQIAVQFIR